MRLRSIARACRCDREGYPPTTLHDRYEACTNRNLQLLSSPQACRNLPKPLSKSSVLLGLSLTVPLMVACLSIAIPIWIRNGYQFWSSRAENVGRAGNHLTLGMKEISVFRNFLLFIYC
ncbi:hypothetical protein FXO38_36467 [Capsicum annuum]|uniref:Uncharacterized protein n=1 Tax=Capsicum annuum TaxID=4072 RepID=A0A2G2XVC4_CAPAN|nr:hypothetical protein FXO38_36467 [Capsicum annuum]KAF3613193.1 hypothetical protein FXO37_36477 [Capsicum annuum]PHT61445.1 hypothetical protein T459_34712 [Capsicum annuum]